MAVSCRQGCRVLVGSVLFSPLQHIIHCLDVARVMMWLFRSFDGTVEALKRQADDA